MSTSVWFDKEAVFDRLVAINEEAIFVANPSTEDVESMAERIRAGESPEEVLPDKRKVVPLSDLVSVESNRHGSTVYYKVKGDKDTKHGNFSMEKEQRDQFFERLHELLKEGFKYSEKEFNRLTAAIRPVVFLAIITGITYVSWQGALEIAAGKSVEITGRRRLIKQLFVWLLDLLGPTGVLIVGGIIGLLCLFWLVRRVQTPPIEMKFERAKK
jgi:hypothetical protein